uniref:Uncharacterized protein n=1 Tax=Plectus sambesii TaxID=2011161 RepID=A0A914VBW6_9BILA
MTVLAAQSTSDCPPLPSPSSSRRTVACRHRLIGDAPKWSAIVSTINMWHGVLALVFIGQYNEIIAFVCANFACVILALGGVFCKKPAMLAPNVAVKIVCIVCLPVSVIYLKMKEAKDSLDSKDIAILVWMVIVEVSLMAEVIFTCNAFKKLDGAEKVTDVIDEKIDPPPEYAVAIIDTELPTYEEAVKLAQAQVHRLSDPSLLSKDTVLVIDVQ